MDLMTALFASQLSGKDAGLPSVDNTDNDKILQVKSGKWEKGDEKLVHISSDSFLDEFHELSEKDTLYLVSGEIEEDVRLNESIESEAVSEDIVTYYPTIIPPEENHEAWRAFHDDDEYGGWSTKYENEENSAFIQYNFQNDFGVALSGIEFNTTYTYLGEEPTPEELPKIHLELELQVCDDSIHHNWTTIWTYDREVDDDGWYGTHVISTDHIYAVRLVCKHSIYDDGNAMISIGNFKFLGMAPNEESESREIWYKGDKFGNVSEGGGSGGPTRTVLYQATDYEHAKIWSSDNWNNVSTWITLADGHTIDEFDEIQIVSLTSEGDQPGVHRYDNLVSYIVNAEDLVPQTGSTDNVKARIFWQSKQSGQQRDCDLSFSHDLTKVHPASMPAWYVIIYAIYGIKY